MKHPLPTITPSIPARSVGDIEALAHVLDGLADMIQVDMVDGDFAPFVSWPFTEHDPHAALSGLAPLARRIAIEVDCMIMHPEAYLDEFIALGARSVVIHKGSTEQYEHIVSRLHDVGIVVGIAVTNDGADDTFFDLVPVFDFVQVMGIVHVGVQGQPFDERVLAVITALRTRWPDLPVSVDGAVNEETLPRLRRAGATRFAPGSAIVRAADPAAAFTRLRALAQAM